MPPERERTEPMLTPKMQIVWDVLEAAKDNRDAVVIAACRRLIVANRLGWKRHAAQADKDLVYAFADGMGMGDAGGTFCIVRGVGAFVPARLDRSIVQ